MNENGFHNKITWFSGVFSILVVWVHAVNWELFLGPEGVNTAVYRVEKIMSGTIAQIAVPGFFMISGYLFYRNFQWNKLTEKWDSRIKSVLVPFLLWNFLYYLGYVIGSRLPFLEEIVAKEKVPFDLFTAVDAVIYYRYNYVFWYLYQLILLITGAPVIYLALKHRWIGAAALTVSFWFAKEGKVIPYLNLDALFYYCFGAYSALYGTSLTEGEQTRKKTILGAAAIIIGSIAFYIPCLAGVEATVVYRTLVPAGVWLLIDLKKIPEPPRWMEYSFFLYATHFAVVRFVNKTAARIFENLWLPALMIYLLMPAAAVGVCCLIAAVLRQFLPGLWILLTGGRKGRRSPC